MKYVLLFFLIVTWLLGWAVAVEVLVDKHGHAPVSELKTDDTHTLVDGVITSTLIRGAENTNRE